MHLTQAMSLLSVVSALCTHPDEDRTDALERATTIIEVGAIPFSKLSLVAHLMFTYATLECKGDS